MIKINQKWLDVSQVQLGISSERASKILQQMGKYQNVYEYETMEQLQFEIELRLQVINAGHLLHKSSAQFTIITLSMSNEQFWRVTNDGAFELQPFVLPHAAIEDIFVNGRKYAFECATAMLITFYKAVLDSIGSEHFNRLFSDLYLYDWQYHQNLAPRFHEGKDYLPGDCVYFRNPDHHPRTPEWQGENAIIVGDSLYYGHGIGITTKQGIINVLNSKRKRNPRVSAFLTQHIISLDSAYFWPFKLKMPREHSVTARDLWHQSNMIVCEIGSKTYIS